MKLDPPTRLRDDPTIASPLRDDLARAASSNPAAGYDLAAGLARFEAALPPGGPGHDSGPSGSVDAPPPAGAGAGAKALLAPALKGALAGVLAVGVAAVVSSRSPRAPESTPPAAVTIPVAHTTIAPPRLDPPATPPVAIPEGASPATPPPPARAALPLRAAPEPTSSPFVPADPRAVAPANPPADPPANAPASPPSLAPAAPPAAAAPASGPDALALEMENLTRLRTMEGADPAGALALAAEGQRRFPGGLFAQEREAIAVRALARLGRTAEARARAEAFLAAYPKSAFAESLRRLTGAADPGRER